MKDNFLGKIQFYNAYSRFVDGRKETYEDMVNRVLFAKNGLFDIGKLTEEEKSLVFDKLSNRVSAGGGRSFWIAGTEWLGRSNSNHFAPFNCISMLMDSPEVFGYAMNLGMQGCGVGEVVETKYISQLPSVKAKTNLSIVGEIVLEKKNRLENTVIYGREWFRNDKDIMIVVGDSRQGWVDAYQGLIDIAFGKYSKQNIINVIIDVSNIRGYGNRLNGFGGVANPSYIRDLFVNVSALLNQAVGRQLTSLEVILILEEAAKNTVSGNIRRVAGMKQGSKDDALFVTAKQNLWQETEKGWRIDPARDGLRMSNHTVVYHTIPTLEEIKTSVRSQFLSGEGAIQYAPEAIARGNADLLNSQEKKEAFIKRYIQSPQLGKKYLASLGNSDDKELEHRITRYGLNPCVTGDTWIHTEQGARQVNDLIGVQQSVYVNGELFSTTPEGFFFTGIKPVVEIKTKQGYSLKLTENHQVLRVTAQTQKKQYTEWVATSELQVGDKILIHNHRGLSKWEGLGTNKEGWLLGNLIGDGCFCVNEASYVYSAQLRYWGDSQIEMKEYALGLVKDCVEYSKQMTGFYKQKEGYYQVASAGLAKLAKSYGIVYKNKTITDEVEKGSYDFYCGFLRGLFDADGSVQGSQEKGVSVRLTQSNLELLQAVQRMLLRLGINSSIYLDRHEEGIRVLPDSERNLKEYFCKATHELIISNDNIPVFQELIGFKEPKKCETLCRLLSNYKRKFNRDRFCVEVTGIIPVGTERVYDCTVPGPSCFDANGIVAHNCAEALGTNFRCNLATVFLARVGKSLNEQIDAFKAAALQAVPLLHLEVDIERFRYSHKIDPMILVSATHINEWFLRYFGTDWLDWWLEGRPDSNIGRMFKREETNILFVWRKTVETTISAYCARVGLNIPNRMTGIKPEGSLGLIASDSGFCGVHFPPSGGFIYTRRKTFSKNDPVALAAMEYGYPCVPSPDSKDKHGYLLDDPFDPRVDTWLIEVPIKESIIDEFPKLADVDIGQIPATAMFDWIMQVQRHYSRHSTSCTINLSESEIDPLSEKIYSAIANNDGYISAALLARAEHYQTFPRMAYEKISLEKYNKMQAEIEKKSAGKTFDDLVQKYLDKHGDSTSGEVACSSEICEIK